MDNRTIREEIAKAVLPIVCGNKRQADRIIEALLPLITAAREEGRREGAEDMRERAARVAYAHQGNHAVCHETGMDLGPGTEFDAGMDEASGKIEAAIRSLPPS